MQSENVNCAVWSEGKEKMNKAKDKINETKKKVLD